MNFVLNWSIQKVFPEVKVVQIVAVALGDLFVSSNLDGKSPNIVRVVIY